MKLTSQRLEHLRMSTTHEFMSLMGELFTIGEVVDAIDAQLAVIRPIQQYIDHLETLIRNTGHDVDGWEWPPQIREVREAMKQLPEWMKESK